MIITLLAGATVGYSLSRYIQWIEEALIAGVLDLRGPK